MRFGAGCLGGHFDDLWCKLIFGFWMGNYARGLKEIERGRGRGRGIVLRREDCHGD